MRYAVIYQSASGNTKRIAEAIYKSIKSESKQLYNLEGLNEIPLADVYLIGCSIRNNTYSMALLDALDEITYGKVAVFATCGYPTTESYRNRLAKALDIWMPDGVENLGLFLCQGRIAEHQKERWLAAIPDHRSQLEQIYAEAESHPDREDIRQACEFAARVQELAGDTDDGSINLWGDHT